MVAAMANMAVLWKGAAMQFAAGLRPSPSALGSDEVRSVEVG